MARRHRTLGTLAVRDADGRRSALATRALWMTGFEAGVDSNWAAALAPHETRDLSVVRVVPDEFDEQADSLFVFAPYANGDADRVAFRIKSLL